MRPRIAQAGAVAGTLALTTTGVAAAATHADNDADAGTAAARAAAAPAPRLAVRVDRKRLHVRAGRVARVRGHLAPAAGDVPVKLQIRRHGAWRTLDRVTTSASGRFHLRARRHGTGSARARIVTGSAPGLRRGSRRVGRLSVFRSAHVSWYGPGLYGGHLACGGRLTPGTLGVANKSLPCGTKVTLRHHGRSVRVPVVDRGPYVAGREYDLTAATAARLRFQGHGALLVTR